MLDAGDLFQGKYRVKRPLGTGSFGAVFLVAHERLPESELALKVIRPPPASAVDYRRRFLQEVRIGCRLRSPHAVPVRDFDATEDGLLYFTMDRVPGEPLDQVIARTGAMPVGRALAIARQVLLALDEAHREGVVHRDVKPGNVLLEERPDGRDFARVLDFGIARFVGSDAVTLEWMGTPHYMAPEQVDTPKLVDGRADLYATGVMLYELVTGVRPFRGPDALGILLLHRSAAPVPPREERPDLAIPPAVEAVILRALEKNRDDRFQSAAAMIEAIDAALVGLPASSGRRAELTSAPAPAADLAHMEVAGSRPPDPLWHSSPTRTGPPSESAPRTGPPSRSAPTSPSASSAASASPSASPSHPSSASSPSASPYSPSPASGAALASNPPAGVPTGSPADRARLVVGGRTDRVLATTRLRIGRRAPLRAGPPPAGAPRRHAFEADLGLVARSDSDPDPGRGGSPEGGGDGHACDILLYAGCVCLRDVSERGVLVDGERAVRGAITYLASRFRVDICGSGIALVGRVFPVRPGDEAPGSVRLELLEGGNDLAWVWLLDEAAIGPEDGPLPLFDDDELGAALRAEEGAIHYVAGSGDERWKVLLSGDSVRIGEARLSAGE